MYPLLQKHPTVVDAEDRMRFWNDHAANTPWTMKFIDAPETKAFCGGHTNRCRNPFASTSRAHISSWLPAEQNLVMPWPPSRRERNGLVTL